MDGVEEEVELFVPGRLALFGEHSDWAGGMRKYEPSLSPGRTIVVGLDCGLHARARRLSERVLRLRSTTEAGDVCEREFPLYDEAALAAAARHGGFFSYAAGVAYVFATEFVCGGLHVDNYATTMPLKKGLSSSAALCVLLARAFNRCHQLGLSTRGEMELAYRGERLTPSQCGRMDQAVAFGCVPVVMTHDGDFLGVEPAQLGAPLHLVLVDLQAAKDTVVILTALQAAFPHPQTPEERALAHLLGPINQDIIARAQQALESGDAQQLGALMVEAQREFDGAAGAVCPAQLGGSGSPVLHKVLEYAAIQHLIWGGKGVGSQGDGTAQLLCKGVEAQAQVCDLLTSQLGMHCMPLTLQPSAANGTQSAAHCSSGAVHLEARVGRLTRELSRAKLEFELALQGAAPLCN